VIGDEVSERWRNDDIDWNRWPVPTYLAENYRDLTGEPDASWDPYWRRCRELNPALPSTMNQALSRVQLMHGDAFALAGSDYDLASMHFVAESITENANEFSEFCSAFAATVRPGGHLIAAFMENMGRYELGDGSQWPGTPVDAAAVRRVFEPITEALQVSRIDPDPGLPNYGYTGMVLLRARQP
jgi:hypothetical protein